MFNYVIYIYTLDCFENIVQILKITRVVNSNCNSHIPKKQVPCLSCSILDTNGLDILNLSVHFSHADNCPQRGSATSALLSKQIFTHPLLAYDYVTISVILISVALHDISMKLKSINYISSCYKLFRWHIVVCCFFLLISISLILIPSYWPFYKTLSASFDISVLSIIKSSHTLWLNYVNDFID
jgi:hypothetical protein